MTIIKGGIRDMRSVIGKSNNAIDPADQTTPTATTLKQTKAVIKFRKKRSSKISDNKLDTQVLNEVFPLVGSRGTINIVDTSNCYHFGSRPGQSDRLILLFQFMSSFSYRTKFFPNKDLIKNSDYLDEIEIKKVNNITKFSDFQFR